VKQVPRWRVAAALVVLAGLIFFLALFTPYYLRNYQLQKFVSAVTQGVENRTKSDDVLRTWVVERARQLNLPITEDEVHITHAPDGMRIDVRYFVKIDLPGYTVNLHFYPGAGTR
jgi:Zn-dependent protease with chaperone function